MTHAPWKHRLPLLFSFGKRWALSFVMLTAIALLSAGSVQLALLVVRLVTSWFGGHSVESLRTLC